MKIESLMTRQVETVSPDTTLQEAARLMKEIDAGVMPVVEGSQLVGILTDRDITVRATAEGRHPGQTMVGEVMTADPAYCFADQEIEEAAILMEEQQIRRLPILDRNGQLVGIVSLGDLAVDAEDDELVGEVLEGISAPANPER